MKKWLDQYKSGGSANSLNRKVTCSNCGWSWKLSDGGMDPMTCHKCGGDIKMQQGGELDKYQQRGQVNFRDQLFQRNKPIIDATAAPILLPPNLNYDKKRVVNSSSAGLNKNQLKQVYKNLKTKADAEKKQEIEEYEASELFHKYNPVAQFLGTRSAPVNSVKPTPRELAYGFGAGINEFYDVPNIGIVNDFVNPLSLVSKGIISPWAQAPLQAQQSDSYLPYAGAALSTALTVPMVRPASIAAKTVLNPRNIYRGALKTGKFLGYKEVPKPTSNINLQLFEFGRKKPIVSEVAPLSQLEKQAIVTQEDLARANRDAITFSQSPANRAKLQEFRPGQDFSITNQQARFIDDPEALKLYESYKLENDPSLSIEQYLGGSRGQYGARDYGDLNDVVLIDKNQPFTSNIPSRSAYTDAMHETTHSRSIRLGATDAEKEIASDAWSPMIKKNNFGMPEEEAFAVQNELRTDKLKDIKGDRVYTEKDIPEIKKGLQEMINEGHDYLRNVNIEDFNIPALIKSLNKIGLGAAVIGIGGKAALQQKKKGGVIKDDRGQVDFRNQLFQQQKPIVENTKINFPKHIQQIPIDPFTHQPLTREQIQMQKFVTPFNKPQPTISQGTWKGNRKTKDNFFDPYLRIIEQDPESEANIGKRKRKELVTKKLPAALGAATIPVAAPTLMASAAPYISAPLTVGATTVPWLTPGTMIGAGFSLHGANQLGNQVSSGYYSSNAPTSEKILTGLTTGLDMLGMPGAVEGLAAHVLSPLYRGALKTNAFLNRGIKNKKIIPETNIVEIPKNKEEAKSITDMLSDMFFKPEEKRSFGSMITDEIETGNFLKNYNKNFKKRYKDYLDFKKEYTDFYNEQVNVFGRTPEEVDPEGIMKDFSNPDYLNNILGYYTYPNARNDIARGLTGDDYAGAYINRKLTEGGRQLLLSESGEGLFKRSADDFGKYEQIKPWEVFDKNYFIRQNKFGGPIVTNRGQWDYPGQTTIIPSNKITMQGVPYPVVGVDNTGHTKMMQPGMNYTFPGQYVTEYPMMQGGGEMIKRADGSYSRRGLWDNLRDNRGSGKKPTKQMLEQERKIRNKKQDGGEEYTYWRTQQPMVNDPSMDAISKVLLQRNLDKNFMQRAAGFGYQGGIPTRYIPGQDPDSDAVSTLLMSFDNNQVFPTIIQTGPNQLSYQPYQTQEYIEAPTWDVADYFATKGYKRAANDMYGMEYKNGGYVVKSGDTLSKIARSTGVSIRQLTSANNLANPNLIRVNQKLVIPAVGGTQPEQSYQNWDDIRRRQDELNALQDNDMYSGDEQRINQYYTNRPDDSYIVIDKKRARMNVYKGNKLQKTYEVGTGANPGDAQTVTRRINGKTDWDSGNRSTGAGVYTISNIDPKSHEYFDLPAFNLKNDRGIEVATTIHGTPMARRAKFDNNDIADNRMSYGCINGKCYDLKDLYGRVDVGSKVYILPEDEGNTMQIVDGKPVLKVNPKNRAKYLQYTDKTGKVQKGQGINQSVNTLQYKPIMGLLDRKSFMNDVYQSFDTDDEEEYKKNTKPYFNSLVNNKKKVMQATNIPSDIYNEIAKISFGIYGAESNFGDENNPINNTLKTVAKVKPISSLFQSIANFKPTIVTDDKIGGPDVRFKASLPGALDSNKSVGFTQIRWSELNKDEKDVLKKLGILSNKDFLDPEKAAMATTAILAVRYNQQLNDNQKKDIWKHLPGKWNKRANYADRVKKNSKYITFKQYDSKYQDGGEIPQAQNGLETFISYLNPYNWGVEDYSKEKDFNKAYSSAKKDGQKEFMYNGKRYNTKYAGTPRQEVGVYGVQGKSVHPMDLNHPAQVNLYPEFGKYLPGHISASIGNNQTSVDYSRIGNYPYGINKVKNKGEKSFNVYGQDNLTFSNKVASLPTGDYYLEDEYRPSDWNLFTNNCADNVCDAFGIPRSKGIQTPKAAMQKIQKKYPTLDVTGRTYDDYYDLGVKLRSISFHRPDEVLNQAKSLVGILSSPDLNNTEVSKKITFALQNALFKKGYKLSKSINKDGELDGILGDETKAALEDWQKKNKILNKKAIGGQSTLNPIVKKDNRNWLDFLKN